MKKWMIIGIFIIQAVIAIILCYSQHHDGIGGPYPTKQLCVNVGCLTPLLT